MFFTCIIYLAKYAMIVRVILCCSPDQEGDPPIRETNLQLEHELISNCVGSIFEFDQIVDSTSSQF